MQHQLRLVLAVRKISGLFKMISKDGILIYLGFFCHEY